MSRSSTIILGCLLVVLAGGFVLWQHRESPFVAKFLGTDSSQSLPVSKATYTCDNGKTITASYFDNGKPAATAPGQPPQPSGSVSLVLSDGRSMTLLQTISGSGIRYANNGESFVFWSKGNTAFVEEGPNHDQTFSGCVTASNIAGEEDWNTFASSTMGLSVRYREGYTVKTDYVYDNLGPKATQIHGVKFVVPIAMTQATNLSSDTGMSVEELQNTNTCSAAQFLDLQGGKAANVTDLGVDYVVASSSGAGAGNFYQETIYVIKDSSPCTAVRYFIHSTNIGNYEPGTVQEYDKAALLAEFDKMRESLVLGR